MVATIERQNSVSVTRRTARAAVAFVMALSVVCGSVSPVFADAGLDDLNFARGLYKQERWGLAEEAFKKFTTKYPEHEQLALGVYYLGLTQFQLEHYKDARDTLGAFVKKFPSSLDVAHAEYRIGECSYYEKDFGRSAREFERALKLYPKDPFREFALAYLGDSQRRLGQYREAATNLQRSLTEFPNGRMADEAQFGLAQAYEGLGSTSEAIASYRKVAGNETAARAAAAQLGLANLMFSAGQFENAATEYQLLEKRFPTSSLVPVAQLNGGFSRYQLKEFSVALPLFDRAEKTASQSVTAGYWKGLTLKALADYAGAAQVLDSVARRAGDDPQAESIVYQLADCHFNAGNLTAAETQFLEVTRRWSTGKLADQSLYFGAECGLQMAQKATGDELVDRLTSVELLLDKFEREYPASGLRLAHDLQRGEFHQLRGTADDLKQAARLYASVLETSTQPQTQNEARFLLARLQQNQGESAKALATLKPLAAIVAADAQNGFPESLILCAQLAMQLDEFPVAIQMSQAYLKSNSTGANRPDAWSYLALAAAKSGNWELTTTATTKLLSDHADDPGISRTIQSVAEVGYSAGQWEQAAQLFKSLIASGEDSPFYPAALSGLAWCEYQVKNFSAAARDFKNLSGSFPKHELAAEAGFMVGDALLKAEDVEGSAAAYEDAFKTFQPSRHAFLAGLQVARIRAKQDRVADADRLYSEIDAAFPKTAEHDSVLNEWAVVLYEKEQFNKADSIFARIVAEHPASQHADNARFSLAESDLISGRVERAQAEFAALADNGKSDGQVREDSIFRLIGIGVELGQWKSVAERAEQLADRFPASPYGAESRFHLGNAKLNLGDNAAAEEILNGLTKSTGDPAIAESAWFPHVWPLLAEAQFRLKKYDVVLETAARLQQWDRESDVAHLVDEVIGRSWKNQAKFDEARAAFKRVIDSEKASRTQTAAKAQLMIAETWFLQQKYDVALENYLRLHLLYKFPEWQAAALYQAGVCEDQLNKKTNAIKTFRAVISEFPNEPYAEKAKQQLKKLGAGS